MKIVRSVDVPRGGWTLVVQPTGVTFSSGSLNHLARKVRAHMEVNGIPVPGDFRGWLEDQVCRNLDVPGHWCGDPEERIVRERTGWTRDDVRRFLVSVRDWGFKHRFSFVEAGEAERRAAICAACPKNAPVKGCLGCSGVLGLVRSLRGNRRTSHDGELHVCNVCGCELRVKVLLPLDALDNRGLVYPDYCWQHPAAADQEHEHESADAGQSNQDGNG